MTRRTGCWFLCFVALVWVGGFVRADEPTAKSAESPAKKAEPEPKKAEPAAKKAEPEPKKAEPATHTVKKGPLRITADLDGFLEAKTAHEIFVKPEEWNMLVVENAVAHGATVRKGDVLLSLETEKLDRVIADIRSELKLSEISIRQGEDQLQALDKTMPLDLEASQRGARMAEEDQKYFLDVEQPFTVKAVDFSLKMANEMLEYDQEELRQLEKMYKADDITEETEQIVLKRARDSVEKSKFRVEYAKLNRDQVLKFSLPRSEDMIKESAQRKALDWEKNRVALPLAQQRQRLDLEKLRVQRERVDDRLKKLLADREMMTVKSPIDGIVYYGRCTKGKFSDSTSLSENLRRNGSIMPNQVVMTVVQARPMFIRASVPEGQLHRFRPGMKGIATPESYPDLKLPTTIDDVSSIPTGPGSFDARLNVELGSKSKRLMPGMTCKVKLVPYLKKDAITVPPKVVATDELDDQKHFVYVLPKDGKPQRRNVKLGEKTDKQVEIVDGLAEGDKVLLEAPKEQK